MSKRVLSFCGPSSIPPQPKKPESRFSRARTSFAEEGSVPFVYVPDTSHRTREPSTDSSDEEPQQVSRPCSLINGTKSNVMCFGNAVLQCLFSVDGLYFSGVITTGASVFEREVAGLFEKEQKVAELSFFEAFKALGSLCQEFADFNQQKDASEFFIKLIQYCPKLNWFEKVLLFICG